MKGIIIYKGKYGATHQYAHSLGSMLHIPVILSDDVQGKDLDRFDYIILGSSVYIGKLQLSDWLKSNVVEIRYKKIFFFIVCGTSPDAKQKLASIARENIPEEIRKGCEVYFLHGRMIKKNLSWKDNILLRMGAMFTKDPDEKKNVLADFDAVKTENIVPLVKAVRFYEFDRPVTTQFRSLAEK
jgi:menaquinone-dependent protoporphyrinogen IX oxidase